MEWLLNIRKWINKYSHEFKQGKIISVDTEDIWQIQPSFFIKKNSTQ